MIAYQSVVISIVIKKFIQGRGFMESGQFKTRSGMPVNPKHLNNNIVPILFQPFYVKKTHSLAEAMQSGKVQSDDELIINELENGAVITLLKSQMAYHHVAQGEHKGEAWMVWF
jgi:hypothetical protein